MRRENDIPLASLPEMVFLLLIFFLVTTTIDLEKGIGLVLPPWNMDPTPIAPDKMVKVLINAENEIAIDGLPILKANMRDMIERKLAANPLLVVSVQTDRQTRYNTYIAVLDQLKHAWGGRPCRISIAEPLLYK